MQGPAPMYGRELAAHREARRFSQAGIAREVGVSRSMISAIENGEKPVSTREMHEKIAHALGLSSQDEDRLWILAARERLFREVGEELFRFHLEEVERAEVGRRREDGHRVAEYIAARQGDRHPDEADELAAWVRTFSPDEARALVDGIFALALASDSTGPRQDANRPRLLLWLARVRSLPLYLRERMFDVTGAVAAGLFEAHTQSPILSESDRALNEAHAAAVARSKAAYEATLRKHRRGRKDHGQ